MDAQDEHKTTAVPKKAADHTAAAVSTRTLAVAARSSKKVAFSLRECILRRMPSYSGSFLSICSSRAWSDAASCGVTGTTITASGHVRRETQKQYANTITREHAPIRRAKGERAPMCWAKGEQAPIMRRAKAKQTPMRWTKGERAYLVVPHCPV